MSPRGGAGGARLPAILFGQPARFSAGPVSYTHLDVYKRQGLPHLADAVENATITVSGAELAVVTAKSYALYFKDNAFEAAVNEVFGKPLRLKVAIAEAGPPAAALKLPPSAGEDQRCV